MTRLNPGVQRAAVAVMALVLCCAGCGSKSETGTVVKDGSPRCQALKKLAPAAGKPTTVAMPVRPATELVQQDLTVGAGPAATDGKQLTVNYVGISCANGQEFDSSWGKGQPDPKTSKPGDKPLMFVLGKGEVIKGWDLGLLGMKVGGRRRLVIPGDLAYGAAGQPPSIAANDTLVFVVDLLDVANPPPTTTAPSTTAPSSASAPSSTTASTPSTVAAPSTTAPATTR